MKKTIFCRHCMNFRTRKNFSLILWGTQHLDVCVCGEETTFRHVCVCVCVCVCEVISVVFDSLQLYGLQPTRLCCLWDSPGRILEWVAMPSSRGSSQLRDRTPSPAAPALQANSLPLSHWGSPQTDE